MTTWHQVRRIVAGTVAAVVAALADRYGVHIVWAAAFGVSAAIITASVLFPLLWRPPAPGPEAGGGTPPQAPGKGRDTGA